MDFQHNFVVSLIFWFYKKERTTNILDKLNQMNDYVRTFEIMPGQVSKIFQPFEFLCLLLKDKKMHIPTKTPPGALHSGNLRCFLLFQVDVNFMLKV